MDHTTRTLERLRQDGDPNTQDALIRARLRAGQIRVERIALLALCGHELSRQLTGITLGVVPLPYREWKRAARAAGKVATLSALTVGLRAASEATPGTPRRAEAEQVLACAEAWCLLRRREEQEALVEKQRALLEANRQPSLHRSMRAAYAYLARVLLDRELDFAGESARVMSEVLTLVRGDEELALAPMREVLVVMTL